MLRIQTILICIFVKEADGGGVTGESIPVIEREFSEVEVMVDAGIEAMSHHDVCVAACKEAGEMRRVIVRALVGIVCRECFGMNDDR